MKPVKVFLSAHAAGQAGLQAQDRLRMQLRHARLGDAEDLADLAQCQLLVVVERDYELLSLGEPRDRLAERLAHLRLGERRLGLRTLGVLDRVQQRDLVAGVPGDRPELVERGYRGARDIREAVVQLLRGDPDLLRDLLVRGGATEARLELADRPLDLPRARAHGPW